MAAYPYEDFISEYEYRGSAVIEQILNLTKEEKENYFVRSLRLPGMKVGHIATISCMIIVRRGHVIK